MEETKHHLTGFDNLYPSTNAAMGSK